MPYIENPKTKDSGIVCAIPQSGKCPNSCEDCFFQSGYSYLEPLEENLPNIPLIEMVKNNVIRINDGHDSNIDRESVERLIREYRGNGISCFVNTSIPYRLEEFQVPVVLTVNPGKMTDLAYHRVDPIPKNLMFIRARTNTWNVSLVDEIVDYYTKGNTPTVLTFMAYHKLNSISHVAFKQDHYIRRVRTKNEYWAITTNAWRHVMRRYEDNILVYSCGKIEGEKGSTLCKYCGNCIREFHNMANRAK